MKKQTQIRKHALRNFGFGIDAMKNLSICEKCFSPEKSNNIFCSVCGAVLPKNNLYMLYKSLHKCCAKCQSVISENMKFCPGCGIEIKKESCK